MSVNEAKLQAARETVRADEPLTAGQSRALARAIERGDDEQFSTAVGAVRQAAEQQTPLGGGGRSALSSSGLTHVCDALTDVVIEHDDPDRRQQAAYVLGSVGRGYDDLDASASRNSHVAGSLAAAATDDPDATVRRNAVDAIGRIGEVRPDRIESFVRTLAEALDDANDWVAAEASRALEIVVEADTSLAFEALPHVEDLVESGDPDAMTAVGRIGSRHPDLVAALVPSLVAVVDANGPHCPEAVTALANVAGADPELVTDARGPIRSRLQDGDLPPRARDAAERALDALPDDDATAEDDDDDSVAEDGGESVDGDRARALFELASDDPAAAADHVDELRALLREASEWHARSKAARAVGLVASEDTARAADAVDDLRTVYRDAREQSVDDADGNRSTARANAAFALARVAKHGRRKAVLPVLSTVADALDDDHDRVRNNAAWTFGYVAGHYPVEVASWWDSLARALRRIDDQHADDLEGKTAQALAGALRRVGAAEVDDLAEAVEPGVAALLASLDEGDDETTNLALYALERLAEDESLLDADVDDLVDRLDSDEPAFQFHAARALGRVGDGAAVDPLRRLSKRTDDDVIEAAVEDALARLDAEPVDDAERSTAASAATTGAASTGGPPDQVPTLPVSSVELDAIELTREIGHGGTAVVHEGRCVLDGEEVAVAVKRPRFSGDETIRAETGRDLLEEGAVWERLDRHDHVVGVLAVGTRDGQPWLVTEYMDGGTLADRAGEVSLREGLWIVERLASALHHAHWNRGVSHLDVKPANVLFRRVDDGWDVPKIADWGLSRRSLDLTTSVYGVTPQYAAPEQQPLTDDDLSPKTDVYQLGAVAYELFVGEPPFTGQEDILAYHRGDAAPPTPSDADASLPPALDDLVQTAMARDPEDRFATDQHLLEAARSIRIPSDG